MSSFFRHHAEHRPYFSSGHPYPGTRVRLRHLARSIPSPCKLPASWLGNFSFVSQLEVPARNFKESFFFFPPVTTPSLAALARIALHVFFNGLILIFLQRSISFCSSFSSWVVQNCTISTFFSWFIRLSNSAFSLKEDVCSL